MTPSARLRCVFSLLTALLILKVTAAVVWKYRDYLPPDFQVDFLRGRELYFYGGYQWAFYTHIASGPVALLLGLILISERFRQRFPKWHRVFGRIQVLNVLLLVAPSGLWMAYYAQAGTSGELGFSALAILTAFCTAMGWRTAVQRRFVSHRRWMMRSYVLLCSAVAIRLIGGLASVTVPVLWIDQWTPWISWLAPLAALEWWNARNRQRPTVEGILQSKRTAAAALSPILHDPKMNVAVAQPGRLLTGSDLSPTL
jgi:hypothetical protein